MREGVTTINEESSVSQAEESPDSRGRGAEKPADIPWRGWKDIAVRVGQNVGEHNISLVAAGVALFGLLAVFPAFNVGMSLYALFSSPEDIINHVEPLRQLLPKEAFELITEQLRNLSAIDGVSVNLTLLVSLIVGFWVARRGAMGLITACNIAYGEEEQRSFWHLMLTSFVFTIIGILGFVALALLAILLPIALGHIPMGGMVENLLRALRWPLLAILFVLILQCVYRFGPNRKNAKWRWVSWGAVIATVMWIFASLGFSFFVSNFGNFNEMYGAIGSVIILILWFYISAFVVLLGAEINAEMEHQTEEDSTVGEEQPMGERGAHVADTSGASSGEASEEER